MSKKKVKMQRRGGGKKIRAAHDSPLHVRKHRSPRRPAPPAPQCGGTRPLRQRKRWRCAGSRGEGGPIRDFWSFSGASEDRQTLARSACAAAELKWETSGNTSIGTLTGAKQFTKFKYTSGQYSFFFVAILQRLKLGEGGGYTYRTKTLRIINLILIIVLQINLPVYCVCLLENTLEGDLNIAQILNFGRKHTHTKSRYHAIVSQSVF